MNNTLKNILKLGILFLIIVMILSIKTTVNAADYQINKLYNGDTDISGVSAKNLLNKTIGQSGSDLNSVTARKKALCVYDNQSIRGNGTWRIKSVIDITTGSPREAIINYIKSGVNKNISKTGSLYSKLAVYAYMQNTNFIDNKKEYSTTLNRYVKQIDKEYRGGISVSGDSQKMPAYDNFINAYANFVTVLESSGSLTNYQKDSNLNYNGKKVGPYNIKLKTAKIDGKTYSAKERSFDVQYAKENSGKVTLTTGVRVAIVINGNYTINSTNNTRNNTYYVGSSNGTPINFNSFDWNSNFYIYGEGIKTAKVTTSYDLYGARLIALDGVEGATFAQNYFYFEGNKVTKHGSDISLTVPGLQIKIVKLEENTNTPVAGVVFKIRQKVGDVYKVVGYYETGANGNITSKVTIKNSKITKREAISNGLVVLQTGSTYEITEYSTPSNYGLNKAKYYIIPDGTSYKSKIDGDKLNGDAFSGSNGIYTFKIHNQGKVLIKLNKKETGNNTPIKGIIFKITRESDNKVMGYYRTDKNGIACEKVSLNSDGTVKSLGTIASKCISLQKGYKYKVIELKNNYYKTNNIVYTIDATGVNCTMSKSSESTDTFTKDASVNYQYDMSIYNVKKTLKISGKVFEDNKIGKNSMANGLYNKDDGDILLKDIKVELYNSKTNALVATTTTDDNGSYLFADLSVTNSDGTVATYYVKYTYNGQKYMPTYYYQGGNSSWNTNSKALESQDERNAYDNKFAIISNTTDVSAVQMCAYTMDYANKSNKSNYSIETSSEFLTFTDAAVELANVNLGLWVRSELDLALMKDVNKVEVKVKGTNQTYTYGERKLDKLTSKDGIVDISERLSQGYYDKLYTRGIYEADYNFNARTSYNGLTLDPSLELEAYVTYEVRVINQSQSLIGKVYEVVDYYDSDYTFVNAEYYNYQIGTNVNNTYGKQLDVKAVSEGQANKLYITGLDQTPLISGDSGYIYLTFKVNKDADNRIKLDSDVGKNNVAEIYAYSSCYAQNTELPNYAPITNQTTLAGRIDRDSNPGNVTDIYNVKTYEDDTDAAPAIAFKISEEYRQVTGYVWDDKKTVENEQQVTTVGNGIFDKGETGVNGVTVELHEMLPVDGKTYDITLAQSTSGEKDKATAIMNATKALTKYVVDEDGEYSFVNFLPGKYYVKYIYGNSDNTVLTNNTTVAGSKGMNSISYNGQDYKSTTYNYDIDYNNPDAKLDFNYLADAQNNLNYSDAKDNYARRQVVESYSNNGMTNRLAEVLASHKGTITYGENAYSNEVMRQYINELTSNTSMFAETGYLNMGVENIAQGQLVSSSDANYNYYRLDHLDFGLQERPKAQVVLDKDVVNVKVVTADNGVLFDATNSMSHLVWLKGEKHGGYKGNLLNGNVMRGRNGLVQLNMDEEIIGGSSIAITYQVTARNIGEVDYDNVGFYYKGVTTDLNSVVKSSANQVVDYVANNLKFDQPANSTWAEANKEELIASGLINSNLATDVQGCNIVLKTESLNKELTPELYNEENSKVSTQLVLSQLITSGDTDSLLYENMVEIVKVTNSVGRRMAYSVVGNQNPAQDVAEVDTDDAESVVITPPTGAYKIIISATIVTVFVALIVIFGISYIRKRVIK